MVGTVPETSWTWPPSITTTDGPACFPGTQARPTNLPASPSVGRQSPAFSSRSMVRVSFLTGARARARLCRSGPQASWVGTTTICATVTRAGCSSA